MKPTRAQQPYRRGARSPGPALDAMLRGRGIGGLNPADITRAAFLVGAAKKSRVARPKRPQRPQRPAR